MGESVLKLGPGRLIIASHNSGKIKEINDLVRPYGIEATSAKELGLIDPEETGKTFEANASLKARASAEGSGLPALADDSGLAVAALDGAPGIYSARWAGEPRDFNLAMTKVEQALKDKNASDYSAKFVCVLCVAWPDGREALFRGEVHGALTFPPRGANGFGYDPIFVPEGFHQTFGEMEAQKKLDMSHRAAAFAKLKKACLDGA
ncbi:MAG: RdgB/HAM1 family non-canonical purine NTP pyrophosphatase [Pseudomonadota bacterium]